MPRGRIVAMNLLAASLLLVFAATLFAAEPRCQVVPLPDNQVSFRIDGEEKTRWHFDEKYPRPFFFPFNAPAGGSLTRMGHPGAPNHDHHRSIWFAHHDVNGHDFWSEHGKTQIVQREWLAYEDGDQRARMAVRLEWKDPDKKVLLLHTLIAELRPLAKGEFVLELHSLFEADHTTFGQSNFGVLAVRVAAPISDHFGDGTITNDKGVKGEKALFGKAAAWMDYSGTLRSGEAGITYFGHPENLNHPGKWHVRADGWMGHSLCRDRTLLVAKGKPVLLKYLLHSHHGRAADPELAKSFARHPQLWFQPCKRPHRRYEIVPMSESSYMRD